MRRRRIAIVTLLSFAAPLVVASSRQWSDLQVGKIRSDGVEHFDFLVRDDVVGVTVGLRRLRDDDNRGGSALELFLNYGSFPTQEAHDQRIKLSATSSNGSLVVEQLRTGYYYLSVRGSLTFDSAPAFVGSHTEFTYSLNITYTACDSALISNNTQVTTDFCAVASMTQAIEPPVSSSEFPLDSYYKMENRLHEGCVDVLRPTLWYTFDIPRPQWDLSITLSTTFAAGFRMVVFGGLHNLTQLPESSVEDEDSLFQSTLIQRGAGFRSASLRFSAPQTGRWTVVITGNLTDNTTCSSNGGGSFNFQARHSALNCSRDDVGSSGSTESTRMPVVPVIASMIDPCYLQFVQLKETRKSPEKLVELLDADFTRDQVTSATFNATERFSAGYQAKIDPLFAGSFIQLRVQATRNIPSFQVLVRVDAFPTLALFDYRFTSSEASSITSTQAINTTTNTSIEMQEYVWTPILFPKTGVWRLLLAADEAASGRELSPVVTVNISLSAFACPEHESDACSSHGTCRVDVSSSGKGYTSCSCDYSFGGEQCESVTVDRTYRGTQIFFVMASNLAILPSVWLCMQRTLYAETVLFLATGVISLLYHACDYDFFCALDSVVLHHVDFALSLNVFAVVVVHLSGARDNLKAALQVFYLLSMVMVSTSDSANSPYAWISLGGICAIQFAMAISYYTVVGASRMGLGKGLAFKAFLFHSKNFDKRYGIAGLVFLAVALSCWFTASSSNYWILHSVWHISAMMAVFCFIALRLNERYQLFAPDFCVDVLATPQQFRFAVSSVKSVDILEEDTSDYDQHQYNVRSWR